MLEQTAAFGCSFCPHTCGSKQGSAIHRLRCLKNPERKVWSRSGVKNGRPRKEQVQRIDGEPSSWCHDAPVRTGKKHEAGAKYCTQCGQPCFWRGNQPLATSWTCKEKGCRSILHYRNGYCRSCYDKRNRKNGVDDDGDDDII